MINCRLSTNYTKKNPKKILKKKVAIGPKTESGQSGQKIELAQFVTVYFKKKFKGVIS